MVLLACALWVYRAIDKDGDLVDVYLSDTRDQAAAEAFFKQAEKTTSITPLQVTTDKEPALYPTSKNTFGVSTTHRDVKYLNNKLEQNHRAIKSRYRVMKNFKDSWSAIIFCTAFEEIRKFFRMKRKTRSQCRRLIASRICDFNTIMNLTLYTRRAQVNREIEIYLIIEGLNFDRTAFTKRIIGEASGA